MDILDRLAKSKFRSGFWQVRRVTPSETRRNPSRPHEKSYGAKVKFLILRSGMKDFE